MNRLIQREGGRETPGGGKFTGKKMSKEIRQRGEKKCSPGERRETMDGWMDG